MNNYKSQLIARHEKLKEHIIALNFKYEANYEHCKRFGIKPTKFLYIPIDLEEFDINTDIDTIQKHIDIITKYISMLEKELAQLSGIFVLISYGNFHNMHAIPTSIRRYLRMTYPGLYDKYTQLSTYYTTFHNMEMNSNNNSYLNICEDIRKANVTKTKRVSFATSTKHT